MLDTLFSGFINGNSYALIALGLSLIIGVSNVINFAHGSLFAIGAMTSWWLTSSFELPLVVGILGALIVTGLLGYIINLVAVKPFTGKAPIGAVLSTIALMIILDNAAQLVFGPQTRRFTSELTRAGFQVGGVKFGTVDLVILATSILCMAGLASFLKWHQLGRAIRATAQDREAAAQMGVPVDRVQSTAFVIAAMLGGLAGVLVALYYSNFSPSQGYLAVIQGIAAATLGGLGSLPGAVVGGILLGIAEAFGVYWWGDSARPLVTFGVLLLVLWIRPAGLFGKRSAIAREPLTGTFFARAQAITLKPWQVALLVVAALSLATPWVGNNYTLQIATQVVTFSLMALSLTLIGGSAGQISLGQAGPVAIGAYTAALLTKDLHWPFLVAVLVAGALAALISVILAAPSWKLSGHYSSIATLATGSIIVAAILNWDDLTGGPRGVSLIPLPDVVLQGLTESWQIYLLGLGILLAALWLTGRLQKSHLGLFWHSIRDDEVAARSSGIAAPQYKSLAYALGGFLAGVAGAFYAAQYGYIDPTNFPFLLSVQILTIAVLGGMLSPVGAVAGATVLIGGLELFRVTNEARLLIYGLVLLLCVRFRPQGLWSKAQSLRPRSAKRVTR